MRINHNIAAMNTLNRLESNSAASTSSLEKLSSGLRINKAADDAAGLAISEKMRGQIRGLDQAGRNAQDGISMIQTAEGGLNEIHSLLQRMRELSVQAGNDTLTSNDRNNLNDELTQLKTEVDRIKDNTEFNTKKLLDGGLTKLNTAAKTQVNDNYSFATTITALSTLAVASVNDRDGNSLKISSGDKVVVSYFTNSGGLVTQSNSALSAGATLSDIFSLITAGAITLNTTDTTIRFTAGGSGTSNAIFGLSIQVYDGANGPIKAPATNALSKFLTTTEPKDTFAEHSAIIQIGANSSQTLSIDLEPVGTDALGLKGIDLKTQQAANSSIPAIDNAVKYVSQERSKLGSLQNRLEHTISNLQNTSENLQAAESRIRDVDMAHQMAEFTKENILTQAAQAMLAQANQQPQSVLQLLK